VASGQKNKVKNRRASQNETLRYQGEPQISRNIGNSHGDGFMSPLPFT